MIQYFAGIRVLAVDLIGTLVQKSGERFFLSGSQFLTQMGYNVSPPKFRKLFRKRYLEYSTGNYEDDREFYSVLLADLSIASWNSAVKRLTDIKIQCSPPFEDASLFLEKASRSYKLVLASNHVGEWAARTLVQNGWEKYFQECVISSDCGFRKPSRQFFLELLRRISDASSPSDVLMVGDSTVNDVYGATRLGLKAAFVNRSRAMRECELLKEIPSFVSLGDLIRVVARERQASC